MEIKEELLFRFFDGTATARETDRIAAWLDADPEAHQKILNGAYDRYVTAIMSAPAEAPRMRLTAAATPRRPRLRRLLIRAGGMAAALLLGAGATYLPLSHRLDEWAAQTTTIEVPAGECMHLALADGSRICLNAGSRVVYPSIFSGRERRIQLSGEAMFDVSHDARRPFIVETFAGNVEVLGTRFNVIADEAEEAFSTALFQGHVCVTLPNGRERVEMSPNAMVNLRNGHLVLSNIRDMDSYRWPEGIISLSGLPFDQVLRKLERSYNVTIIRKRPDEPAIGYRNIKIRISDGIVHALDLLRNASDFSYVYDETDNVITIE